MICAVPKESAPRETRCALAPEDAKALVQAGHEIRVAEGAGAAAGFADAAYENAGARIVQDAFAEAELLLTVQGPAEAELPRLPQGAALAALLRPLDEPRRAQQLAARGISAFALELLPRITRAQSMDVLSSQATVAGYRAVLLAAGRLPRMFPMLVTAAGTVSPARVFVVGAGVAGLQAIATAKRLGAVVSAYDTRAAAAEQVESLGARFVTLAEAQGAEDSGGYAKAQSEAFYQKQREALAEHAAKNDAVITTALVPGRRAPLLLTEAAVRAMPAGAVVVDLAAANGGNCALTQADEEVQAGGATVLGPTNLPGDLPGNASRMFSRNITAFVKHIAPAPECKLQFNLEDEITAAALLTHAGEIRDARVREKLHAAPAGEGA